MTSRVTVGRETPSIAATSRVGHVSFGSLWVSAIGPPDDRSRSHAHSSLPDDSDESEAPEAEGVDGYRALRSASNAAAIDFGMRPLGERS